MSDRDLIIMILSSLVLGLHSDAGDVWKRWRIGATPSAPYSSPVLRSIVTHLTPVLRSIVIHSTPVLLPRVIIQMINIHVFAPYMYLPLF